MPLLTKGTAALSDSFTGFGGPTPHTGLPCLVLIHEEELSLDIPCFIDTYGRPALSWIEMEENGIAGWGVGAEAG